MALARQLQHLLVRVSPGQPGWVQPSPSVVVNRVCSRVALPSGCIGLLPLRFPICCHESRLLPIAFHPETPWCLRDHLAEPVPLCPSPAFSPEWERVPSPCPHLWGSSQLRVRRPVPWVSTHQAWEGTRRKQEPGSQCRRPSRSTSACSRLTPADDQYRGSRLQRNPTRSSSHRFPYPWLPFPQRSVSR